MYKRISGDSTPLTQKERCLEKSPENLFFESHLCRSLTGLALHIFFPTFSENPNQVQLLSCPTTGMMKAEGSLVSLLVMANMSLSIFNSLHYFSIHVIHPVDFFLNFLGHHRRLLLGGELLVEEYLPTRIHLSILTYPKIGEAIKREVSPFLHKVSIKGTKVLLDFIAAFKESRTFIGQSSLEIREFNHSFPFFSKSYTSYIPHVFHHRNHFMATI